MRLILTLLMLVSLPFIHGCAAVAIGGAAATGYMLGEDRRTVGTITEDQSIEFKAGNRIAEKYKNVNVNVTSYNRLVLLTGEVPDQAARDDIEKLVRAVENVRGVTNETRAAQVSPLTARNNDSYITSKVKARFVDAQQFNPLYVKVVTEAGVVYLMGLVTRKEAESATEIARTTSGVQKVVRIFEYTD